jgi:uncharacterized delta-60 repeat protein
MIVHRATSCALALALVTAVHANDANLDPAFAGTGSRILPLEAAGANSSSDEAFDVVRDAQGRYLVFITSRPSIQGDSGPRNVAVVRLLADGNIDTGFGTAGRVQHASGMVETADADIDSQGRMLIAGTVFTSGTPASAASAVLRLSANGQRDPSFGSNGLSGFDFLNAFEEARAIRIDSSNNVVVGGHARDVLGNLDFYVVRLRALGGGVDTTFGAGGMRRIGFDVGSDRQDVLGGMALMGDGRIVVVGAAFGDTSPAIEGQVAIARLTPGGAFDPTFCATATCIADSPPGNNAGKRAIEARPRNGLVALPAGTAVAIDGIGGIVIAGESVIPAADEEAGFLLRLDINGDLDRGFGNALSPGFRDIAVDRTQVFAKDVLIDAQRRIVVSGFVRREPATLDAKALFATRFLVNGALDTAFAVGGSAYAEYGFGGSVGGFAGRTLQDGGRMLMTGYVLGAGTGRDAIVLAIGEPAFANGFE